MELPDMIVTSRVEIEAMAEMPSISRVLSLQAQELEDEEFLDHPIPPATETWGEHIAELRRRIAEIDAGVPGMSVEEAFASIRAELGWTSPAIEKRA